MELFRDKDSVCAVEIPPPFFDAVEKLAPEMRRDRNGRINLVRALVRVVDIDEVHRGIMTTSPRDSESQAEKFKQAARELGCDEDEARWDERLRKVAQQKPEPDKAR